MKIIYLLADEGKGIRPLTWSRPKPLLTMAGNTLLGHILFQMQDVVAKAAEVIFVVGAQGEQIRTWVSETLPQLNGRYVVQPEPLGQAHALWLCREWLDDDEVIVAFGDGVVITNFAELADGQADVTLGVQSVAEPQHFGVVAVEDDGYVTDLVEKPQRPISDLAAVGVYWFRSGRLLAEALAQVIERGGTDLSAVLRHLLAENVNLKAKFVDRWLEAGTLAGAFYTHNRLLALGYGSEDALERSYAEEFAVIPPVFIHPEAEIVSAVIGPYASVGAGAVVRQAVVQNSVVEANAHVENCVLDNGWIGMGARVAGAVQQLVLGDGASFEARGDFPAERE